jgi:hypothetical protein
LQTSDRASLQIAQDAGKLAGSAKKTLALAATMIAACGKLH